MITFLDFHRTLFDTDAYELATRQGETVDPSAFVYPDAVQALRSLENNGVVVTSAAEDFVASALKHIPRLTILATAGMIKEAYLASWPGYYGQAAVFVDDSPDELVQLTEVHPALTGVEIRRDEKEGDGKFKVITSLSEL